MAGSLACLRGRPQVFLIEYAGPLLLYPLLFGVAILFHGPWSYSWVQSYATA